ncbi:hypothetical protein [Shewanella benthica]|uniref:Possible metal-dependent hydrolase n=1 Tax=Shewanella benthica KT99 TaxID=314608 RepID=A9D645_9GAMM|nr:hypothetical protein [Shewanella benthica]EDQ01204.1 possible metal-dependent hydrolase [Shewanella benthica KT99]
MAAEVEQTTKMFGNNTKVRFLDKQVKILMDGAIISQLMQMEDYLGSIKTGQIANFTILEQNPYKVELDSLKDIQVYDTVFKGKLFPVKH